MFDIKENLKKLPDCPGVYIHRDKLGNVIYVGKAISLKNRVRQYFQSPKTMDPKVKAMALQIEEFEYIRCNSETEALILEDNLIKKYKPKYNILLRDDKTYPYIKITNQEEWPRIMKTRIVKRDGNKYFGPYSDVMAVNRTVELLNYIYKLKKCSAVKFAKGFRPCLNFHIGQCEGICINKANKEEYAKRLNSAIEYLNGKNKSLEKYLEKKMMEEAESMNYEEAAKYRDYIFSAKALQEKQHAVLKAKVNVDVVLVTKKSHVVIFFVREGKLVGRETYLLKTAMEDTAKETVAAFLKQYYTALEQGPAEILLKEVPEEWQAIEGLLENKWKKKVKIQRPQKGEKKALLELCQKDVIELNKTIDEKELHKKERDNSLSQEVHNILSEYFDKKEKKTDYRIEAYDISNTNGVETVGAMVVFNGLYPDKKSYRRFKVRTIEGPNDYGSMQEVIYRRIKRLKEGDGGFSLLPDLILVDGGKGHVSAALEILEAMKVDIPLAGMVKDDAHRTKALIFPNGKEFDEMSLGGKPLLFQYVGKIQEEVHRFAIDYHRNRRDKKSLLSILDKIEGVGPIKRNALLAYFGSVEKIKMAKKEDLIKVKGITDKLADEIIKYFH